MQKALNYSLVAALIAILVGGVGSRIAGPEAVRAVWIGAGSALMIQLLFFFVLFVVAFARHPLLAHGLGMLGRLFVVATAALFWVPWAGLPAAPFLFSLVAVFFGTTLMEPLFMLRSSPAH